MRFIDTNIFIHAWLKPKRKLSEAEKKVKENSKIILKRVDRGEKVATSIVHISEIANILEAKLGVEKSIEYIEAIIGSDSIKILDVTYQDILEALEVNKEYDIGLVDAIAYVLMIKNRIGEIYTMDKDFKKLPIKILEK